MYNGFSDNDCRGLVAGLHSFECQAVASLGDTMCRSIITSLVNSNYLYKHKVSGSILHTTHFTGDGDFTIIQ